MPRLSNKDLENTRTKINLAALKCFSTAGFNGVTMRDIAAQAKVPLGSLYNYYDNKQNLFSHIITEQSALFLSNENDVVRYFLNSKFPDDLPILADAIRDSLKKYKYYFKLMYVDVVEFDGANIREVFSDLEKKFTAVLGNRFRQTGLLGQKKIDPAFALISIYLSFYQYFVLSRLFGATHIYGKRSETEVVDGLIELLFHGIKGQDH
jgi:AcrR family transcriptional regulator